MICYKNIKRAVKTFLHEVKISWNIKYDRPRMTQEEYDEYLKKLRMYVLVRRDILPLDYCIPQTSHAVAEYVHYHNNETTKQWVETDKTLIILSATNDQIHEMKEYFSNNNMNYQPFWEPDMDFLETAVAFQPIPTEQGFDLFKELKLLN